MSFWKKIAKGLVKAAVWAAGHADAVEVILAEVKKNK
jgi:hypothetical protein